MKSLLCRCFVLVPALFAGLLAGCNPTDESLEDEEEDVGTAASAIEAHDVGPFGDATGTCEAAGTNNTRIYKVQTWADAFYVYGVRVYRANDAGVLHGTDAHGVLQTMNVGPSEAIDKVEVFSDGSMLRGLRFTGTDGTALAAGLHPTFTVAFNDPAYKWSDLTVCTKTVNSKPTIVGASFRYIVPPP